MLIFLLLSHLLPSRGLDAGRFLSVNLVKVLAYLSLIHWLVRRGRKKEGTRYVNVYVQYLYLIPHDRLVLNHRLQVACIRGSRTLCVPLPADMHRTLQRGRRNPSRLGRAALSNRA